MDSRSGVVSAAVTIVVAFPAIVETKVLESTGLDIAVLEAADSAGVSAVGVAEAGLPFGEDVAAPGTRDTPAICDDASGAWSWETVGAGFVGEEVAETAAPAAGLGVGTDSETGAAAGSVVSDATGRLAITAGGVVAAAGALVDSTAGVVVGSDGGEVLVGLDTGSSADVAGGYPGVRRNI
jgi:hypothetical protein